MTDQPTAHASLEMLGGLGGVQRIMQDFDDRVFDDMMIGFMFYGVDKARLVDKESEFVARLLGARDVTYTGKSMPRAHAKHRIMGGQFARRQQILRETLADHDVPASLAERWLAHNEALRPQITGDQGSDCDPALAERRAAAFEETSD